MSVLTPSRKFMINYIQEQAPYLNPHVDRRVAVILGGCSGIGWYTVLHLFLHGYTVYITGRSRARVVKCINELRDEAMKLRAQYSSADLNSRFLGELIYLEIDLSDLKSVLTAARTLKKLEDNLNIVINNIGVSSMPFSMTPDGFDIQMQTNYISPCLLIAKVLPLLENTVNLHPHIDPPRIIHTSSVCHFLEISYFDMASDFKRKPEALVSWFRYAKAQTSGIHFVKMLSLRNPKILSLIVDPGFVMNPNAFSYLTRLPIIGILFWCFFQIFGFFFGISIEQGAFSVINCCLNPSLTLEEDNGKCFNAKGKETKPSRIANNLDYAARTWIWTVNQLNERNITIPS